MESGLTKLIQYISKKDVGYVFRRKDFVALGDTINIAPGSMSMYSNVLRSAGFLRTVEPGKYEYIQKLPVNTTSREVSLLAKGDRLRYLEVVTKRKENERIQAEEQARLLELTRINTAILISVRNNPCKDCNLPLPDYVKIFSYRQPQTKYHHLSQMITLPTDKLRSELDKCDLICLNCHAIRLHDGKHSVYNEITL